MIQEKVNEAAALGFNRWKDNATEEQKQKGLDHLKKYQEDPSYATKEMEHMTAAFAKADADGDGRLNKQEFMNWSAALQEEAVKEGHWVDEDPTNNEMYWEASNMVENNPAGCTMATLLMIIGAAMAKTEELKNAQ